MEATVVILNSSWWVTELEQWHWRGKDEHVRLYNRGSAGLGSDWLWKWCRRSRKQK